MTHTDKTPSLKNTSHQRPSESDDTSSSDSVRTAAPSQQLLSESSNLAAKATPSHQRALDIPEILGLILLFLTLQAPHHSAQLVCKQWHAICKSFSPVAFTWILRLTPNNASSDNSNNNNDEGQTIRELVSLAQNITIRVDDITLSKKPSQQRLTSWTTMMNTLSSIILEHELRKAHPKLQSLHLKAGVFESFTIQLSQLPRVPFLSTLRIDMAACWEWDIIHLLSILKECPNLEDLSVKPAFDSSATVVNSMNSQTSTVLSTSQERAYINALFPHPVETRLRTCILHSTMVSQPTLIFLLQSSPHLSKLVLARVTHYTRLDHTTHLDDPTPSIVDSIGIHCPNVKAFHISVSQSHEEVIDQELLSVFEKLPKVEEYSFIIDNLLEPHLMDGLRTVANRVTTLNLLPRQQYTSWVTGVPLGEILCTFKHLVHFRAPTAVYYHEDMDLHNVLQRTPNRTNISSKTVARQYIWTCRELRTLHFTVGFRKRTEDTPSTALVMFGFLSRMCPRLQELYINRHAGDFPFEAGLCLLARLQDLERIRIIGGYCTALTVASLFWMGPTHWQSTSDDHSDYLLRHLQKPSRSWDGFHVLNTIG